MIDPEPLRLSFDRFELDEANARLSRDGRPVALAPKAFAVLCALARQSGQLVTKNALLDAVWGHQHVSESVLKTIVSELREALSDEAKNPRYIETAPRRGYRFIGAAASAQSPLPASHEGTSTPVALPPMVGRHDALNRLRQSWTNAQTGRRQVFWITGEAGVGKTTLIDNFVVGIEPAFYAHGQCVEQHGAGEPYLPVLSALGELCRNDPSLAGLLRAVAPTWMVQLPWLINDAERESLRRELSGTSQERMLREFGELLDRYTQERPLLLVTEDLHWSDHATVHLINHVARRRAPARLMWLASFRLAEVIAEDHPLKTLRHELRLHRLCEEITLESFSEREVADYVVDRFPDSEVSEDFVRALHGRTDGLPLFLVNVIEDLMARGGRQAETLSENSLASLQVPENLAGVIEKQITRLAPEQRSLLEIASVCGVEFRPATVAHALERDVGWTNEHCDRLARQQQWLNALAVDRLPDGTLEARYAFRHALYRNVFYQRIGAFTRAQLHKRVAASLLASRDSGVVVTAAELASHYELSHDPAAALAQYAEAAENALRHFAPREALSLTAHAMELLQRIPGSSERDTSEMELLGPRAIAASQLLGTHAAESIALFERIDALSESRSGKSNRGIELELGWVFQRRGEYDKACALAARKLAVAERRADRLLSVSACNLRGATLFFQGDLNGARRYLEQGMAAFPDVADQVDQVSFVMDPRASLHARLARVLSHLGLPGQARSSIDIALTRARTRGQPYGLNYALIQAGIVAIRLGEPERALEHAHALQKTVTDHAAVEGEALAGWLRGCALVHLGELDTGLTLLLDAYTDLVRRGRIGSGCAAVLGYAGYALMQLGRWSEAQARLDEAMALARRIGERIHLPDLLMLRARAALGRGDAAVCRALLTEARSEAREQRALWLELTALVALCELDDAAPADLEALREARERLSEGFDTALVLRVDRLLPGDKKLQA
jgi:DNA-binding winged helix-turn-helix (wHTH) protein/tetratricopeptide (TPR) repeat protein